MENAGNTLPIWAQWLFGSGIVTLIVGFFVTFIASGIKAWKRLGSRFDSIDSKMTTLEGSLSRIESSLDQLRTQSNGHLAITGRLVASLFAKGDLSQEDMTLILSSYANLAQIPPIPNNPISPEEHKRLNDYIEKARQGTVFTSEEVEDYQAIVKKIQEEKPDDRELWALLGLGALLLGLFLLGKQEE